MKERPILFTPENAQKVHFGTKTQTRLIVRWPLWVTHDDKLKLSLQSPATGLAYYIDGQPVKRFTCPYGQPGDRLWVRETFCAGDPAHPPGIGIIPRTQIKPGMKVVYRATAEFGDEPPPWRPSIYMPRWACRTALKLTAVHVEQLDKISAEDAIAEGIEYHNGHGVGHSGYRHESKHGFVYPTAKEAYRVLWESINGPELWALNPWVWVLEFTRVTV